MWPKALPHGAGSQTLSAICSPSQHSQSGSGWCHLGSYLPGAPHWQCWRIASQGQKWGWCLHCSAMKQSSQVLLGPAPKSSLHIHSCSAPSKALPVPRQFLEAWPSWLRHMPSSCRHFLLGAGAGSWPSQAGRRAGLSCAGGVGCMGGSAGEGNPLTWRRKGERKPGL